MIRDNDRNQLHAFRSIKQTNKKLHPVVTLIMCLEHFVGLRWYGVPFAPQSRGDFQNIENI